MSSLGRTKWVSQRNEAFLLRDESINRFQVLGVTPQGYLLVAANGDQTQCATCAVSCLLEPITGDQVLAFQDNETRETFILAVLTRSNANAHRSYAFSDAVRLEATDSDLKLQANSMHLEAAECNVKFQQFHGAYGHLSETANSASLVAGELTQSIGRFLGKFRDFFKRVDGLDRTQASNIEQTAAHQLLLRSDFTKIRSTHVVKIDANKIDLG
jgi:hypothetical protein